MNKFIRLEQHSCHVRENEGGNQGLVKELCVAYCDVNKTEFLTS